MLSSHLGSSKARMCVMSRTLSHGWIKFRGLSYSLVRPLSTVEYTSVASVFHSRQCSNLTHDRCSCTLFTFSSAAPSVCSIWVIHA